MQGLGSYSIIFKLFPIIKQKQYLIISSLWPLYQITEILSFSTVEQNQVQPTLFWMWEKGTEINKEIRLWMLLTIKTYFVLEK